MPQNGFRVFQRCLLLHFRELVQRILIGFQLVSRVAAQVAVPQQIIFVGERCRADHDDRAEYTVGGFGNAMSQCSAETMSHNHDHGGIDQQIIGEVLSRQHRIVDDFFLHRH